MGPAFARLPERLNEDALYKHWVISNAVLGA